jgi:hypothetical protein
MPRCGATFDENSPLAKGAPFRDSSRGAAGGCPVGLRKPSRQPPEGFAFFPPLVKGDSQSVGLIPDPCSLSLATFAP